MLNLKITCPFCLSLTTRMVDVLPEQIRAWQAGALIQDAMPDVSPVDREWLITGLCPVCQDKFDSECEAAEYA